MDLEKMADDARRAVADAMLHPRRAISNGQAPHEGRAHPHHAQEFERQNRTVLQLNCTPQDPEALWPLDDPSWSAEQVIDSINAARRPMRVPFYIYEGLLGVRRVEDELQRLVGARQQLKGGGREA